VFVPISDDNPLKSIRFQFVTVGLIALNVLIFAASAAAPDPRMIGSFALIPNELFRVGVWGGPANGPFDIWPVAERYTLISYMFFHGDIFHLIGNMLFLWVFGDNVEDAMGHGRFLAFYLLCGIAGALAHAAFVAVVGGPNLGVPLIGASGAVAGVIAAYLMLHPHVRVWVLVFRFIPLRITAMFALGAWIATQLVMVALPQVGPTAWWAHIGGLVAGAALVIVMRRPGIALFDRG
jgi:membrane associated rhomboid family serine protease